ncbi:hypothetical protein [Niallia sp. Man26]|uniref:hypothetical protein n=1 Tax=Niallia sp. Man26 TaxID=2912824 RepID=UPI001EDAE6B7|nr:hypothetical protein [Niallia sp. Man26]UPO88326.1 hypothetical protein L8T27_003935 [Niallia sp. Man26]
MKQLDNKVNEVQLGILTKEILKEMIPNMSDMELNHTLKKYKYYNTLKSGYIYSEEYVKQNKLTPVAPLK